PLEDTERGGKRKAPKTAERIMHGKRCGVAPDDELREPASVEPAAGRRFVEPGLAEDQPVGIPLRSGEERADLGRILLAVGVELNDRREPARIRHGVATPKRAAPAAIDRQMLDVDPRQLLRQRRQRRRRLGATAVVDDETRQIERGEPVEYGADRLTVIEDRNQQTGLHANRTRPEDTRLASSQSRKSSVLRSTETSTLRCTTSAGRSGPLNFSASILRTATGPPSSSRAASSTQLICATPGTTGKPARCSRSSGTLRTRSRRCSPGVSSRTCGARRVSIRLRWRAAETAAGTADRTGHRDSRGSASNDRPAHRRRAVP